MDIKQATRTYESWLGRHMPLIAADLRRKHERMAEDPFAFLRATFYVWIERWPAVCSELVDAPSVLGVGDLHVENFGTWRDAEGRLVWGVNDFDEACQLPYTNDLVRLAASALLAIKENHLACPSRDVCEAILEGYLAALDQGGRPVVLAERHAWLRELAKSELRDPIPFWQKLDHWRPVNYLVPADIKQALRDALPEPSLPFKVVHRQAGLGSLGRRRFTALAEWRGGMIAREAKELTISAWHWQDSGPQNSALYYEQIIAQAVRVADPFLKFHQHWLIRRLAPDCSRVELYSLPELKMEVKLLRAMGWETANVHLGTKGIARKIQRDRRNRPAKWLQKAASAMVEATLADWKLWRSK
jgi:hypothetical protein